MCGIAGIFGGDPAALDRVRAMAGALVHRGPDDQGFFSDGRVALGMRRLAIVDIAGGRQPLCNESGTIWLVFNGEIYNHAELRAQLLQHGHVFRSKSDGETIIHGYEQWGIEGCLERLRGMFALLLWDAPQRCLFAARDRLGIKPLYYAQVERQWRLASEIKALLACPDTPRAVNTDEIGSYLVHQYVPAPTTLFAGIYKMLPGHYLRVSEDGAMVQRPFWRLSFEPDGPPPAFAKAAEAVRERVSEAVRLHLMSEVPLGCLLSGGLDSSIVAASMAWHSEEPTRTFTVGFPGQPDLDERQYARVVAERYGTVHTEIEMSLSVTDLLERVVFHLDEPLADAAALPTYAICKAAREHVTVVLTGEGGDEVFAGYPRYWLSRIADRLASFPAERRRAVLEGLATLVPADRAARALQKLAEAADDPLARNARWTGVFSASEAAALPRTSVPPLATPEDVAWPYAADRPPRDGLHRLLYWDLRRWLVDDVLMKVDKMSMAASVEARVPFLDHCLLEYVAQLPPEYKLRRGRGKAVLREAFREWLPRPILARRKAAFRLPLDEWFRGDLSGWAAEVLRAPRSFCRAYLDARAVEQLLAAHLARAASNGQKLWTLLCAELWYAQWFTNERPSCQRRPGKRARGVLVVPDLPSEGWPSMDRYARGLLRHLDASMPHHVVGESPTTRFKGNGSCTNLTRYWNRLVAYPASVRSHRPDAVHVLDQTYAHILLHFPGCPSLVTVHDLWLLRRPRTRLSARQFVLDGLTSYVLAGLRRATILCADSAFSARETQELLGIPPERIRVVPLGLDSAFFDPVPAEHVRDFANQLFGHRAPRLLHVGSCDPRKNVEGLLHIVAELRGVAPAACLLQVGGCFSPLQRALITQLGIAEAVTQLERMSEEGLRLAYHAADVLLLPSLYEGFGFPILEAQAAALPVLCSDRGSLPDIAGDGAVVLDPTQPSAWATSMLEVVEGATRRDRLVAKGLRNARHYTWQRTAASVATIYEELLGS